MIKCQQNDLATSSQGGTKWIIIRRFIRNKIVRDLHKTRPI